MAKTSESNCAPSCRARTWVTTPAMVTGSRSGSSRRGHHDVVELQVTAPGARPSRTAAGSRRRCRAPGRPPRPSVVMCLLIRDLHPAPGHRHSVGPRPRRAIPRHIADSTPRDQGPAIAGAIQRSSASPRASVREPRRRDSGRLRCVMRCAYRRSGACPRRQDVPGRSEPAASGQRSGGGGPATIRPAPGPASSGETVRHSSSTRSAAVSAPNRCGPPSQSTWSQPARAQPVRPRRGRPRVSPQITTSATAASAAAPVGRGAPCVSTTGRTGASAKTGLRRVERRARPRPPPASGTRPARGARRQARRCVVEPDRPVAPPGAACRRRPAARRRASRRMAKTRLSASPDSPAEKPSTSTAPSRLVTKFDRSRARPRGGAYASAQRVVVQSARGGRSGPCRHHATAAGYSPARPVAGGVRFGRAVLAVAPGAARTLVVLPDPARPADHVDSLRRARAQSRMGPMPRQIYQLQGHPGDVTPAVWRRVLVPGGYTLDRVHRVFQHAMGWPDCHLHSFDIDGVQYGEPDPDGESGRSRRAGHPAGRGGRGSATGSATPTTSATGGSTTSLVEDVFAGRPGRAYPLCVDGERACPPEDVGGAFGYGRLLAALGDRGAPGARRDARLARARPATRRVRARTGHHPAAPHGLTPPAAARPERVNFSRWAARPSWPRARAGAPLAAFVSAARSAKSLGNELGTLPTTR